MKALNKWGSVKSNPPVFGGAPLFCNLQELRLSLWPQMVYLKVNETEL
jgi:hypothetical protein